MKGFRDFLKEDVSANGFQLGARDAADTAKNINMIFVQRARWFSLPKPIHIDELREAYREMCPGMDLHYPGVIEKIFHPEIVRKLGYPVDSAGMVHYTP